MVSLEQSGDQVKENIPEQTELSPMQSQSALDNTELDNLNDRLYRDGKPNDTNKNPLGVEVKVK